MRNNNAEFHEILFKYINYCFATNYYKFSRLKQCIYYLVVSYKSKKVRTKFLCSGSHRLQSRFWSGCVPFWSLMPSSSLMQWLANSLP